MIVGHSRLLQCTSLALLTLLSICSTLDQPAGTEAQGTSPWESQAEAPAVEGDQQSTAADADTDHQPAICVVARTYWAHGGSNVEELQQGIRSLISSLQIQSNPRWEALLVVMDSKPFVDLHLILQEIGDDRVWVFAEWIGVDYTSKQGGRWTEGYHERLYSLTDDAIRACPADTEWVLLSNGDNEYAASFFSRVGRVKEADIVAVDFYSRYQRITGTPCERFAREVGAPACKVNKLRWCQTDLGSYMLRWPRLIQEGRRFGGMATEANGLSAEHFDGVLAQTLVAAGWQSHSIHECLFDHSPTPQRCARLGGVWDDSDTGVNVGGRCLDSWQASRLMMTAHGDLEQIDVQLSFDEHISEFLGPVQPATLRCIRRRNFQQQHVEVMAYFGEMCAEDVDLPAHRTSEFLEASKLYYERLDKKSVEEQQQQQQQQQQQEEPPLLVPQPPKPGGKVSSRDVAR